MNSSAACDDDDDDDDNDDGDDDDDNNNNNNNNNNVPKSIETSQGGKVPILWNQQVQTDRTIPQLQTRHYNP